MPELPDLKKLVQDAHGQRAVFDSDLRLARHAYLQALKDAEETALRMYNDGPKRSPAPPYAWSQAWGSGTCDVADAIATRRREIEEGAR